MREDECVYWRPCVINRQGLRQGRALCVCACVCLCVCVQSCKSKTCCLCAHVLMQCSSVVSLRHCDRWDGNQPFVTSVMQYLKSGPPQLQDMSSRLNDWFERSMMISMALDFKRAIWSSAVSSLEKTVTETDTECYWTGMFIVGHRHC